jgi:lipopolysaccharide export system protein LptA
VCVTVVAAYFYGRHRVQNALKQVPEKLNIQIKQSAHGFTISRSEQGRTLFKLQAAKAIQFKQGGRIELHDVTITMYGKESSRFDQIYGKEFEYDQRSGNVTSKGEVSIDLQSNPEGVLHPDQTAPQELKNPIHLKTTDLVFNQKTGNAWTPSKVELHIPRVNGSAIGAKYDAGESTLTLQSQVNMVIAGTSPLYLHAQHAVLKKNPREVVLQQPVANSGKRQAQAQEAILYLREDNGLARGVAKGNVILASDGSHGQRSSRPKALDASRVTADELDVSMRPGNAPDSAIFLGNVHFDGPQDTHGTAGRGVVSFGLNEKIRKIHADQNVTIVQPQGSDKKTAQEIEVTTPALDLFMAAGEHLSRAETTGPPKIRLLPLAGQSGPETQVTADKFTGKFDALGQLSRIHGEAHARVVTKVLSQNNKAEPDRVSTSDSIDAYFGAGTGIESLVQQGNFEYKSGAQQAFSDRAAYTPADRILNLSGKPRLVDSGMETTAESIRISRATGEGFATGDVKTNYSEVKPEAGGALMGSSDPVHVVADSMTARTKPTGAIYKGHARLWQGANFIEAAMIEFHKAERTMIAESNSNQKVTTALILLDNNGKAVPVHLTSDHFRYSGESRKARYSGSVIARSQDFTLTSNQMDVFFTPPESEGRSASSSANTSATGGAPLAAKTTNVRPSRVDKIIATGSVIMIQPRRRATGEKLVYTGVDDKFVLTGGPPSIFDAEHGKITGVSLTLYRTDDRVVVDGNSSSPAVTETRVER